MKLAELRPDMNFKVAAFSVAQKLNYNILNSIVYQKNETSFSFTVKPVLSGHSKLDKISVLNTNGSLMKVESIAECSLGAF